ncbi:MAG: GNAT family N-acetyltransferase [Deltaproteobacteria bacterium]|nr:GNAT family N-acetyltransferase [Deltaproteobacteria bacterium]MBI3390082.1 GNAT family N-acetyltransferase [Deltaproteobacteria bacterium]
MGDQNDRVDAIRVRRQVYCTELGYQGEEDAVDQRAHLCVVRTNDGEAVASLRIVGPAQRPFEIETFRSLDEILPLEHRAAEISRFCALPAFRSISSLVHLAAFKFAFGLADCEGFSHFVIWSKPILAPIYRYLLFETIRDVQFEHPGLGNERHAVLVLDLRDIVTRYRQTRPALWSLLPQSEERS